MSIFLFQKKTAEQNMTSKEWFMSCGCTEDEAEWLASAPRDLVRKIYTDPNTLTRRREEVKIE